jgi:tetratricopeptide (TPR) repeat protein
MELAQLIQHPEKMNKETLYDLRSLLALHPYYQTARLLMLQNLYILHSPSFDEELRRAAIYITDRKVLFQMIEAAHYKLHTLRKDDKPAVTQQDNSSRTVALIDNFLESIPADEDNEETNKQHRKPTPADAAVDYVAYLLETEDEDNKVEDVQEQEDGEAKSSGSRTIDLIDNFIHDGGFNLSTEEGEQEQNEKIDEDLLIPEEQYNLEEATKNMPDTTVEEQEEEEGVEKQADSPTEGKETDESYFTETLARIYIKQGRYEKALEIIQRLYLNYPKKNAYFADQMRFLEKLIINNKNNK